MLETSHERVELLKAGISIKTIEKLFLMCNKFKIVGSPVLFEPVEEPRKVRRHHMNHSASAHYEEVSG